MNTGLFIKKGGESNYGRIRRFFIANHSSVTGYNDLRKALIARLSLDPYEYNKNIKNTKLINLIYYYESDFVGIHLIPTEIAKFDQIGINQSISNCPKCTMLGYHAEIFNKKGIRRCPIHNEPLVEFCHLCDKKWPCPTEMFKRDCKGCGVRLTMKDLLHVAKFESSKEFKINEKIKKLIFNGIDSFEPTFKILNQWPLRETYHRINEPTEFTPSLFIHLAKSSLERRILNKTMFESFEVFSKSFTSKSTKPNINYYEHSKKLEKRIIKDIEKDIINYLDVNFFDKESENKSITDCSVNYITWKFWTYFSDLDKHNEKRINHQSFKNSYDVQNFLLLNAHWTNFDFPRIPLYLRDDRFLDHEQTSNYFKLPYEIQKIIYKIDLWTFFIHMYNCIKHLKLLQKNINREYVDVKLPVLAQNGNDQFCPYYINKDDNLWYSFNLFLPNILNEQLYVKKKYERLTF